MIEVKEVLYRWCKGLGKRTISRSLGMSVNTVRKLLRDAEQLGLKQQDDCQKIEEIAIFLMEQYQKVPCRATSIQSLLHQHHEKIEAYLKISHMTVPQMLRLFAEEGFLFKETSLRIYIKRNFPQIKTTVHLEIKPGQAQIDFGFVGKMIEPKSGDLKKAYAFVMTLSYSRMRFVHFVFRQDVSTWIECHIEAFRFFGYVPRTIVLDNLRAGVLRADIYDPTLNPVYAEFEKYYGFIADPAKIAKPTYKARVERSILIVKEQLIAGRNYKDIVAANEYAKRWAKEEIAQKICRTTGETPWERFCKEERQAMLALPKEPFDSPIWQEAKVHRDQHIVFQGSFYSVPYDYVGKSLWVRANARLIQCFLNGRLVKTHVRSYKKGNWVTDIKDYPTAARSFLEKTSEVCLKEGKAIGDSAYEWIKTVLKEETATRLRKVQGILRLKEKYSPERLEAACRRALSFGNYLSFGIMIIKVLKIS